MLSPVFPTAGAIGLRPLGTDGSFNATRRSGPGGKLPFPGRVLCIAGSLFGGKDTVLIW